MGLLVLTCFVCLTILPTLIVATNNPCHPRTEGQHWSERNGMCTCRNGQPSCQARLGHCIGSGDIHYRSIDGKRFDFQGLCRYVLMSNCGMLRKFTIEVEQARWLTTNAAVSNSFTIRFGRYTVILTKNPCKVQVFIVNTEFPGLPLYDDTNIRVERIWGWIYVTLKRLKVWFRWNCRYSFDVWVSYTRYHNKLCGLCGDFNGNKGNDLRLTPYNEKVTSVNEWGDAWRVAGHHQPARCLCASSSPPTPTDCTAHTDNMNECNTLMTGSVFAACNVEVDPAPFIKDCRVEMCECAGIGREGCLCVGVSGYMKACEAAGMVIDMAWTVAAKCPVCKDPDTGMVYQNGAVWTYQCKDRSCLNGVVQETPKTDCIFSNETIGNNSNGEPVSLIAGCVINDNYFMDGHERVHLCNKYKCTGGEWVFVERICCYQNGQSYEVNEVWDENPCRRCVCNQDWTITCTDTPITCPTGFVVTDTCCCIPKPWADRQTKR